MDMAASAGRAGVTMLLVVAVIHWVIGEHLSPDRAIGIAVGCFIISGVIAVAVLAWRGWWSTIDK